MNINDLLSIKYKLRSMCEKGPVIQGTLKKTGIPVLFSKNTYENESVVSVVSRMVNSNQERPWVVRQVYAKDIIITSVEEFKPAILYTEKKISAWDMYTATIHNSSVTYVFKNKMDFIKTLKNIESLSDNYTYKTAFKKKRNLSNFIELLKHNKDNVILTISLYDIRAFSPIYVEDKVDGIGIAIEAVDVRNSAICGVPEHIQSSYVLLSNYKENLFYMDGITIQPYEKNISLEQQINSYLKVFKAVKKTDEAKPTSKGLYSSTYTGRIHAISINNLFHDDDDDNSIEAALETSLGTTYKEIEENLEDLSHENVTIKTYGISDSVHFSNSEVKTSIRCLEGDSQRRIKQPRRQNIKPVPIAVPTATPTWRGKTKPVEVEYGTATMTGRSRREMPLFDMEIADTFAELESNIKVTKKHKKIPKFKVKSK